MDKRLVLVTGASRGIGRAAAVALAEAGAHVLAVARSQKALEALYDEVSAAGGEITCAPLDLKDFAAIDHLCGVVLERWRKLDGLFANAGVLGAITPLGQAKPSMMEEVLAVNVMANWRLIRAFDPLLRAAPAGRAVFVSSGAAHKNTAYWGPYAAAKAAMETLALTYAAEVKMTPLKVNVLNPGPVRTAMRAKAFPGEDPDTLPPPDALAPLIVKLLSPAHEGTGEVITWTRETAGV
jgi:NAD(P)-dependent dehydrogenase (short-subunit alcohol dehydrogenase family)